MMEGLYESEIAQLLQEVRDQLLDGADMDKVDNTHAQLVQAIKQLEAEARTQADASSRKALQAKVKQFREDAKKLRQDARAKREERDRTSLMGRAGDLEAQERLMSANEKMERGSRSLKNSLQTMLEIEQTAADVSEQLAQNSATIDSARRKVAHTNTLSGQARGLLNKLERNERFKKLFAFGAMGIVGFALLFLVYSTFFGL